MIVYCITNKINQKQYIGMSIRTLEERWKSHCTAARNGSPFRFHAAIRKYGEENFDTEVLYTLDSVDECRTVEEQTIAEYNTMTLGYNARKGGCGGFIVPDEKYDDWVAKITKTSTKENNGRWCGHSDEFIIDECVNLFNSYDDKEEFSFVNVLNELRKIYPRIPKSFSKNRFSDYDGGFKGELARRLNIPLDDLTNLSNKKSKKWKESLRQANIGNNWWSSDELKLSKQSKTCPGDGWVKGRNYGY